jgi:hypothetical protein
MRAKRIAVMCCNKGDASYVSSIIAGKRALEIIDTA